MGYSHAFRRFVRCFEAILPMFRRVFRLQNRCPGCVFQKNVHVPVSMFQGVWDTPPPGLKFSQKFQPNRAKSRNPKTVEGPKNGRNRRSAIPGVPGFVCTRSAYVRRALKRFDHRMIDANNRYPQNSSLWATLLKAHNHNSVPDF